MHEMKLIGAFHVEMSAITWNFMSLESFSIYKAER